MIKKFIKSAEVLKALGITSRTLNSWRQLDLPYKHGKPCKYDIVEFHKWLLAGDRIEYALAFEVAFMKKTAKKKKKKAKKKAVSKNTKKKKSSKKPPPIAQVEDKKEESKETKPPDIFEQKEIMADLIKDQRDIIKKSSSSATEKLAATNIMIKVSELARKYELNCLDVDERLKNVILISEVHRLIGSILTKIKTDLRNLPYALAEKIAAVTDSDPQTIVDILKPSINDALRHASGELAKPRIKQIQKK